MRILTVCTGNICRSPLAAQLLASRLDPAVFEVASAGTSPVIDDQMPHTAQRIAERLGVVSPESHRAAALTPEALQQADLVLGMDREHRRWAAQLEPTAVRRSFTLIEFAHIVTQADCDKMSDLIDATENIEMAALKAVMRMRGVVPRLRPERAYDVEDPYGRSKQVYERSSRQILRAVEDVVAFFDRARSLAPNAAQKAPR